MLPKKSLSFASNSADAYLFLFLYFIFLLVAIRPTWTKLWLIYKIPSKMKMKVNIFPVYLFLVHVLVFLPARNMMDGRGENGDEQTIFFLFIKVRCRYNILYQIIKYICNIYKLRLHVA